MKGVLTGLARVPLLAVFLLSLPPGAAESRAQAQPRTQGDPRVEAYAAFGEPFDPADFARLALIASGAGDETVSALGERLEALAVELAGRLSTLPDDRARGDGVLAFIYKRVLTRYSEFQTRLDLALETGEYNCVSSALLYYYFARRSGLEVSAVETPVHAFCTVTVGGKRVDVETTNPFGFEPGVKRELPSGDENRKRYAVVPQTNYLNRKNVGERRLIALVYNNRVTLLEREGNFSEAVALALDAWVLQGTEAARVFLAERCLNYASSLEARGEGDRALDFVGKAESLWGPYPRYREFSALAVSKALNALMDASDYSGAFGYLASREGYLEAKTASGMRRLLTSNYLGDFAGNHGLEETLAEVSRYRDSLSEADYGKVVSFAFLRESEKAAQNGDWLAAAAVTDRGLEALPGRADLRQARSAYRQNYAVTVHNRAAEAFNSGDAAGARAILEEGLRRVPENATLKADLRRLGN